jgi:hypothetical protein
MHTPPVGATEALACRPTLNVVVHGEGRLTLHQVLSLGCLSYLHPNQGHSVVMQLQRLDLMFTMRSDTVRPVLNFEGGWDRLVSVMTCYGRDSPGIEYQWGRDFPQLSRLALGPTQPPIQRVLNGILDGKVSGAWH